MVRERFRVGACEASCRRKSRPALEFANAVNTHKPVGGFESPTASYLGSLMREGVDCVKGFGLCERELIV